MATTENTKTSSYTSVGIQTEDVEDDNVAVDDVKNATGKAAEMASSLMKGNLTFVTDNIKGLLGGDFTTKDGQVIPKQTMVSTACVLFTDFTATFIAYTVLANVYAFGATFLGYHPADLKKSMLIMSTVDAVFYLLNGCLADIYGHYNRAILMYSVFSVVGAALLSIITFNWAKFNPSFVIPIPNRRIVYYIARVVISFGITGVQVTARPLAARMVQQYGIKSVQRCYHYIYMAIRTANLLALTSLAFMQVNISFFSGYVSSLIVKVLSMGCLFYIRQLLQQDHQDNTDNTQDESEMRETTKKKGIRDYFRDFLHQHSSKRSTNMEDMKDEEEIQELIDLSSVNSPTSSEFLKETNVNDTLTPSTAAVAFGDDYITSGSGSENSSTDEENVEERTGALREAASKALLVFFAILLLSCQVPYSIVRYQLSNFYANQAQRMSPSVLGKEISPYILHAYLPLIGIALTPIFDIYIYPYISKKFIPMTMLNRIKIGIGLATLSVLAAAVVETARMSYIHRGSSFVQEINNQTIVVANLSLNAILPQYLLMSGADIFIYITSLQFAFCQSPKNMQAAVTGIMLCFVLIGKMLAFVLVPLINDMTAADPWCPLEINDGHLNYYFFVLTAISLANLIVFCLIAQVYERVRKYFDQEYTEDGEFGSTTTVTADTTTPTAHDKKPPTTASGTPSMSDQ